MQKEYLSFYGERREETYGNAHFTMQAINHPYYSSLRGFIDKFELKTRRCLEIGSSSGFFQDMVDDYYGTDISDRLSQYYHKPYSVANGAHYSFADESFDAIWTITVYEHIPELQEALFEIRRLLKPGGVLYFAPAWQCRSWAAQGYPVRPYRDFDWKGKLIKASIPFRNNLIWRSLFIFPKRLFRQFLLVCGYRFSRMPYQKLKPNYEVYWMSDADACNSMDPHDAILWFLCNGFVCLSHPNSLRAFFVRNGPLIFKKIS